VRGVVALVGDGEGRTLFVRHTYGDRSRWELPGGAVRRAEAPGEAILREAREEIGADLAEVELVGTAPGRWNADHETLWVFRARWDGPVRIDGVELSEARWFAEPPAPLGDAAGKAVALAARRAR
jgi:8-oxo-dGTP pyrophosphatase MutT (NUDIX family)